MPPEADFTLDGYRALLDSFEERGYRTRWFDHIGYGSKSRGTTGNGHPVYHAAVTVGRYRLLLDELAAHCRVFPQGRHEL